jgi:hypothetical protein
VIEQTRRMQRLPPFDQNGAHRDAKCRTELTEHHIQRDVIKELLLFDPSDGAAANGRQQGAIARTALAHAAL